MKKTIITLASIATLTVSANAQLYADTVVSSNLGPGSLAPFNDVTAALGAPDYVADPFSGFVSLGTDGTIRLSFGGSFSNNGTSAYDIYVGEVGTTPESYTVSISENNLDWIFLGVSPGGSQGFDLDAAGLTGDYNYVRISDLSNSTPAPYAGADIDFVAVSLPVPEPSSTALLGLGALGLLIRRKR